MATRIAPTVRQRRLGIELRKLRERAGLSATQAAQMLGLTQSRVSNIEIGRLGVSAERVRTFAQAYGCSDCKLVDALTDMPDAKSRNWWDAYRERLVSGLLDLAELEHHATAIRTAQIALLPGLLQTSDYSRVVVQENIPSLPPPVVEQRVSFRIQRQEILYREEPTPYTAIIHEAALRMQFGGRDVTRDQLRHIVAMSERPNITVRVIPFSAGIIPGTGQTVLYAEGVVPQLDTVQLDIEHGATFLHADAQLEKYRTFMQCVQRASMAPAESRDFINRVVTSL